MPVKRVMLNKLTSAMKKRLQDHAKDHSVPHMRAMRWDIMQGVGFKEAHKLAMRKHGK